MIGSKLQSLIENSIVLYENSQLHALLARTGEYAIKFVQSRWAAKYLTQNPLKISETPALTWGTATYVTPIVFPLSSALYGRVGLVTSFDPSGWRVFDATRPQSRLAYTRWVQAQPAFRDLLLTVHSTHANHILRDKFRRDFKIDCVLFYPDQEAELHTDRWRHAWMAVTDWTSTGEIDSMFSGRLSQARFTVLLDEEFALEEQGGLPVRRAPRTIEGATEKIRSHDCADIRTARTDSALPSDIVRHYASGSYLHLYIAP